MQFSPNSHLLYKRRDSHYFYLLGLFLSANILYLLSVYYSHRATYHYSNADFIGHDLIPVSAVFLISILLGMVISYSFRDRHISAPVVTEQVNFKKLNLVIYALLAINFIITLSVVYVYKGIPLLMYFDENFSVVDANTMQSNLFPSSLGLSLLINHVVIYLSMLALLRLEIKSIERTKYYLFFIIVGLFSMLFGKLGTIIFIGFFFLYERCVSGRVLSTIPAIILFFFIINFISVYRSQGIIDSAFSFSPLLYIFDYYSHSSMIMLYFIYNETFKGYDFSILYELYRTLPSFILDMVDYGRSSEKNNFIEDNILIQGAPSGYYGYYLSGGFYLIAMFGLLTGVVSGWFINRINRLYYDVFYSFLMFAAFVSPVHVIMINHFYLLLPMIAIYLLRPIIFFNSSGAYLKHPA